MMRTDWRGARFAAIDPLCDVARYYDAIMAFVDYYRWVTVATAIADLLPAGFVHLDAACGTGRLMKRLVRGGWNCIGVDLSFAMLRAGRKGGVVPRVASADLRALPVIRSVDYVTCLFDSINFLLDAEDMRRAVREMTGALTENGLLYLDVITERMVTQHFAGQKWTEDNGQFTTTWQTEYCRQTCVAETHIQVNNGPAAVIHERVYTQEEIERAFEDAGLTLLGVFDALTWCKPNRKTIRMDFVAAKTDSRALRKRFKAVGEQVRRSLP